MLSEPTELLSVDSSRVHWAPSDDKRYVQLTNLIQSSLVREDGDVPIIGGAVCSLKWLAVPIQGCWSSGMAQRTRHLDVLIWVE